MTAIEELYTAFENDDNRCRPRYCRRRNASCIPYQDNTDSLVTSIFPGQKNNKCKCYCQCKDSFYYDQEAKKCIRRSITFARTPATTTESSHRSSQSATDYAAEFWNEDNKCRTRYCRRRRATCVPFDGDTNSMTGDISEPKENKCECYCRCKDGFYYNEDSDKCIAIPVTRPTATTAVISTRTTRISSQPAPTPPTTNVPDIPSTSGKTVPSASPIPVQSEGGSNVGLIVGVTLGLLLLIIVAVVVVLLLLKRRRGKDYERPQPSSPTDEAIYMDIPGGRGNMYERPEFINGGKQVSNPEYELSETNKAKPTDNMRYTSIDSGRSNSGTAVFPQPSSNDTYLTPVDSHKENRNIQTGQIQPTSGAGRSSRPQKLPSEPEYREIAYGQNSNNYAPPQSPVYQDTDNPSSPLSPVTGYRELSYGPSSAYAGLNGDGTGGRGQEYKELGSSPEPQYQALVR